MSETKFTVQNDKKTLVIERNFSAPRSKVWAAWTTPELFAKWWGPKCWETTVKHMDFREGGYLHYGMTCQEPEDKEWFGKTSWGKSTYHNIDAENGFDYTDYFCDENGNVAPGMPAIDISLQFVEEDGFTRVVSTSVFAKPEDLEKVIAMGMEDGIRQTWDRLDELVRV
jgi:uncharacterized protein YndB with AHSA1/START domain